MTSETFVYGSRGRLFSCKDDQGLGRSESTSYFTSVPYVTKVTSNDRIRLVEHNSMANAGENREKRAILIPERPDFYGHLRGPIKHTSNCSSDRNFRQISVLRRSSDLF
jgi:hypothetical protein